MSDSRDASSPSCGEHFCGSLNIFASGAPKKCGGAEEAELKRQIYARMNPRRRKFIDKLGFENWDPFQEPKAPLDMRKDVTGRACNDLIAAFLQSCPEKANEPAWRKAARECAMGIVLQDEKYQAIFDFCLWYYNLLHREGHVK